MMNRVILIVSAILLSFLATPSRADGYYGDYRWWPVHGAYMAQLDLNPLGVSRIEAFGFLLHADGTVTANSEHELDDLESAGIGVWKPLRNGQFGVGVLNFRMGTAGGCTLIFGVVTPDNCILKLGATLDRKKDGSLVGNALLSFEALDGAVFTVPAALPITLKRLSIEDFPGAMPAP